MRLAHRAEAYTADGLFVELGRLASAAAEQQRQIESTRTTPTTTPISIIPLRNCSKPDRGDPPRPTAHYVVGEFSGAGGGGRRVDQ
jgi:hypothetical protein